MASLMDSFEQQFASLTADITTKTGRIPNLTKGDKKVLVNQVEKHLEEAQELMEQMDLEVKSMPPNDRPKYQNRMKSYHAEFNRLNKELKHAKIAFSDDVYSREELFGEDISSFEDQKIQLLDNTERLERSSRKLHSGYKIAIETEQIGAEILNDLHSQRETIQKATEKLRETDNDLYKSSRILSGMIRRIIQNRLILFVVGSIMLCVIVTAIYFIIKRS